MANLNVGDLIAIVAADAPDVEKRLEKVFEWQHSRDLEIVKWLLTVSGALAVPMIVSVFKEEMKAPRWEIGAAFALAVILGGVAAMRLWEMGRLQSDYLASMTLVSRLVSIRTFLIRTRAE